MVNCTLNRQKGFGKSMKKKIAAGFAVVILAFLYYYFTLPAINIHESGFWIFMAAILVLILAVY